MLGFYLFCVTLHVVMDNNEIEQILECHGIKPTANRLIVLKTLIAQHRPLSLSMLENILLSMDKSSIFRVLSLFFEHDVVHTFEDGRGILNYELCHHHHGKHDSTHAHFYCESCARSFCLEDIPVGNIQLPTGFVAHSVSFVIKGVCPDCQSKQKHLVR